jgi:cytochrome c-type biogenesis protein CcmH
VLGTGSPSHAEVLFIIARSASGGPPVAVKKISHPAFPLEFSLGTADNMVGEDFFEGNLQIVARLDADGNAGPKQPGDVEGTAAVSERSRRVQIIIGGASL